MNPFSKFLSAESNEISICIGYKNLSITSSIKLFGSGHYVCKLNFYRNENLVLPQSLKCEDAVKLLTLYKEKVNLLRDQKSQGGLKFINNIYRLTLDSKKSLKNLVGGIDNWSIITIFNRDDNFIKTINFLNGIKLNIIPPKYTADENGLHFHNCNTIIVDILRNKKYSIIMNSFKKLFSILNLILFTSSTATALLSMLPIVTSYYTFDVIIPLNRNIIVAICDFCLY